MNPGRAFSPEDVLNSVDLGAQGEGSQRARWTPVWGIQPLGGLGNGADTDPARPGLQ